MSRWLAFVMLALVTLLPVLTAKSAQLSSHAGLVPQNAAPARSAPAQGGAFRVAQAKTNRFAVQDISGPAGQPLSIRLTLPRIDAEPFAVVMFRGLPETFKLSAGFSLRRSWAVSPSELPGLTLNAPAGFKGEFPVEVLFIHGQKRLKESRKITVRIGPEVAGATAAQASRGAQPPIAPEPVSSSSSKSRQRPPSRPNQAVEKAILKRAAGLVREGDIAAARLFYDYLATQGNAYAAFLMARTFDVEFLGKLDVMGMRPDMTQARNWYQLAVRLGSKEAATRLSALAGQ